MNKFEKEYVTGRKDQFDVDYAIFKKAIEETETREELIAKIEERFNYVISHVVSERARDLMQEMNLI
jgi:activator of HSP90 ATPase